MKFRYLALATVALACLSTSASAETNCTDQNLVDQAVETANTIKNPMFGNIEVLGTPFNIRSNRSQFHTDLKCVANVVANRGEILLFYDFKIINGEKYISVHATLDTSIAPNIDLHPQQTATPVTPVDPIQPSAANLRDEASFFSGKAHRMAWENFIGGIVGDERDGAIWWSGQRSLKTQGSCSTATNDQFRRGCEEAQAILGPSDVLRKTNPAYRYGWNSL